MASPKRSLYVKRGCRQTAQNGVPSGGLHSEPGPSRTKGTCAIPPVLVLKPVSLSPALRSYRSHYRASWASAAHKSTL
eukprot:scaffold3691_cov394-Prasinococcus_capsulatus_cf.AAC.5